MYDSLCLLQVINNAKHAYLSYMDVSSFFFFFFFLL